MSFKPLQIKIENIDKFNWQSRVSGNEYKLCSEAAKQFWCNKKSGTFGRGLCATKTDPYKPVRTGLLGEIGFAKLFNLTVDIAYNDFGNANDFIIDNLSFDIKTATRNYNKGLIRCRTDAGKEVKLKSDIYVFAYIIEDNIDKNFSIIQYMGFLEKDNIEKQPVVPAVVGKHFNYEINYKVLKEFKLCKNLINI